MEQKPHKLYADDLHSFSENHEKYKCTERYQQKVLREVKLLYISSR